MQVLALTYEGATASELLPYLHTAFYPLRVMCCYGKWAKHEGVRSLPESNIGKGREIVGCMWKDCIIPYVADKRQPPDFGVLIVEQDMRFYRADCNALEQLDKYPDLKKLKFDDRVLCYPKRTGDLPAPTPELKDILAVISKARRWETEGCPDGHSGLVWLSWEPVTLGGNHYGWVADTDRRPYVAGTGNYMWYLDNRTANKILDVLKVALPTERETPQNAVPCFL